MANSQFRSKRKVSGKRYVATRKTRSSELGGIPASTHIGTPKTKTKRKMGGSTKQSLLRAEIVQVFDGKNTRSLKITGVEENPANINFTRRNVITKGAIVKTENGNVKITSRPGQSGNLFGVFI